MRFRAQLSRNKHEVFPFRSGSRSLGWPKTEDMTLGQAIELWYRAEEITVTVVWTIDPSTSATSSSTYTRSFVLGRSLDGTLKERTLLWPGLQRDLQDDETGPYEVWKWVSGTENQGVDDVFTETTTDVTLELFRDGYEHPGNSDAPEGYVRPSIYLALNMTYDDGSEGTLRIAAPDYGGMDVPQTRVDADATIEGIEFACEGTDDQAASIYLLAGPVVTLEITKWYPYARADNSAPIWDSATGAQLLEIPQVPV